MKVSELTGAQLDFWVAQADGLKPFLEDGSGRCWLVRKSDGQVAIIGAAKGAAIQELRYSPSSMWALGGPIIEREHIAIVRAYRDNQQWDAYHEGSYCGPDGQVDGAGEIAEGPTPLIAAMRAFVASRFGEEVPAE